MLEWDKRRNGTREHTQSSRLEDERRYVSLEYVHVRVIEHNVIEHNVIEHSYSYTIHVRITRNCFIGFVSNGEHNT